MDKKIIAGGALAALVLTAATVGSVSAQSVAEATGLSEEQAIEIALSEMDGEVQEVELESEDGQMVYEIEILNADQETYEVVLAADTGEVLEVEADGDDDKRDCKDKA